LILSNKLKKTRNDQFDKNLENHLDSLGIKSIKGYQQWCSENGFSRRLKKSQADRRKERIAIATRQPHAQVKTLKRSRFSHRQTVERIFSGEISHLDAGEKHHLKLLDSNKRLEQLPSNKRATARLALERLYHACQQRQVKFLMNSRPAMPQALFRSCTFVEALASVAAFSDQWVRPLEDWKFRTHNQRKQFESLVQHLFAVHEVPSFFYSVWARPEFEVGLREQKAFVHVAAGHSIRKAETPIPMSKKMSHHFLRAPSDLGYPQAIRWGQVRGLNGDVMLARAVLGTFLHEDFSNASFWNSVIVWFIEHPMLDRDLFGVVIDYLNNQKFGHGNMTRVEVAFDGTQRTVVDAPQRPNLAMKGRTPQALLRDVNRWHGELQRNRRGKCHVKWPHCGINELHLVEGKDKSSIWTIRQLLGTAELNKEGQEMNHCVASYANSCFHGRTSIWSMRQQTSKKAEQRMLTIEVLLGDRTICQVRGKNNRRAHADELPVISRWAQASELSLSTYV
jgi:hypothetical protein